MPIFNKKMNAKNIADAGAGNSAFRAGHGARYFLCFAAILLMGAAPLWAQASFKLKSAPADLNVLLNGDLIKPLSAASGIRNYKIDKEGVLSFTAAGYQTIEYHSSVLPVKKGLVEIKLELEKGLLQYKAEYKTGSQPKSAYFSPDGKRLFVPLLGQHGIDVFQQMGGFLKYEKRLTVPGSKSAGFVEALCDEKRRELWISNMEEDKLHVYDLDTLEYKTSVGTGGIFPKVVVQNPSGDITVTSNWVSMDLSFFDSDSKKLLYKIPVGGTPRGLAFSPDGSLLYTAIYDASLVVVVDMAQKKITSRYRFAQGEGAARHIIYSNGKLYVSDMFRGTVNILDASTGALLRSKYVGMNINTIILSSDGRYVFAASRGRNNPVDYTTPGPDFGAVYMLNAEDLSLIEKIWGRNQPTGLGMSPDGKLLVFTDFLDENLELYWMP